MGMSARRRAAAEGCRTAIALASDPQRLGALPLDELRAAAAIL